MRMISWLRCQETTTSIDSGSVMPFALETDALKAHGIPPRYRHIARSLPCKADSELIRQATYWVVGSGSPGNCRAFDKKVGKDGAASKPDGRPYFNSRPDPAPPRHSIAARGGETLPGLRPMEKCDPNGFWRGRPKSHHRADWRTARRSGGPDRPPFRRAGGQDP